jgi:predicted enzyme related to lactoylglutathione lyase
MNAVVWFEVYVNDKERARSFYERVFATKLEKIEDPSGETEMWSFPSSGPETPGAAGALVKMQGVGPGGSGTLVYFGCDDCAVQADRIPAAGGKIERPKMQIGPHGFICIAKDPEGNTIGLHSMK